VTDIHFDDLDELLRLAGAGPSSDEHPESADGVLRALLHESREDDLAARIVLQRLMPGLLATVRRRARGSSTEGLLEELVGAAWITIRCYDPGRRPSCLAAALLCSAEHRAFRAPERRRAADERVLDPSTLSSRSEPCSATACEELADLLADARLAGIDDADLDLLRRLVEVGSTVRLAAELGVTPRTIRNRRDRVTYRLRKLALAA
jgi:hypothetical protein